MGKRDRARGPDLSRPEVPERRQREVDGLLLPVPVQEAEKLGAARKSVMGGFDKKLNAVAKDYSQGAVDSMRKSLP